MEPGPDFKALLGPQWSAAYEYRLVPKAVADEWTKTKGWTLMRAGRDGGPDAIVGKLLGPAPVAKRKTPVYKKKVAPAKRTPKRKKPTTKRRR